ncbi:MAG: hypothetical protein MN733_36240, partial [Nitrososphaera sp.]|nr:hypothetical protein [Nitrososphaera sp.]
GSVAAFCLFVAAITAALAGRPGDFYIAGGNPDILRGWSWDGDRSQWRDEVDMLDATAQRQAKSINKDKEILEKGSKLINISLFFALASPFLGLIFYFLVPLCAN